VVAAEQGWQGGRGSVGSKSASARQGELQWDRRQHRRIRPCRRTLSSRLAASSAAQQYPNSGAAVSTCQPRMRIGRASPPRLLGGAARWRSSRLSSMGPAKLRASPAAFSAPSRR
jgi:hypothetical protein